MNTTTPHIAKTTHIGSEDVHVGGVYEHYKGKQYTVVLKAWGSERDELVPLIIYQGDYEDPNLGKNPIFAQTEERFLEPVVINGIVTPRFTLIKK